jgi:hypothetical protein
MSITNNLSDRGIESKKEIESEIENFLKNGGKITKLKTGDSTEAKDMKYKFRRPVNKKKD